MKFKVTLLGILLVLFSVSFQTVLSQEVSIRGVVTSAEDGTVLPNANVVLSTDAEKRVAATATNVDGFYELENLEPGTYRIRITYIGYQTHRDTVSVQSGRRRYNATIAPSEKQLEEIRVEAERGAAHREAGLQTVRAADVERIPTPAPGGDLAAYMQTLPGVLSLGDRGGQLYIRGGTPSQNLVLVDGLRVIKPFHISNIFSAFPEEAIEGAEIYAGGFGAQYMGAISSVIDVSLRQGNMKHFEGSLSASPFLVGGRVEGPLNEGDESILAIARRSVIEESGPALYGRDVPIDFYDVTTRYSFQGENGSCNLTGMRTHDEGQINADRALILSWSNTVLGGRCLLFGEGLEQVVDLRAGYSRFYNEAGTPDAPQRSATLQKVYLRARSDRELFGKTVDYGGRWVLNNYEYDLHERFTGLQKSDNVAGAAQFHAKMDWTVGDWLTVTPSAGTHITARRLLSPTFEPRLRMTVRPTGSERREISVAAGKYNQVAEGLTDERDAGTVFTVWRPSQEDEPLIQALHGILGYRHQVGSYLTLNLEGYAKKLSNVPAPEWSPVARFDVQTALADGLVYGADFRAEVEMNDLYAFLGYGWSKVTYEAARDDLGAWVGGDLVEYSPPHDRRHQVNVVASYALGEFTANASWQFGSGRPYTRVVGFDLSLEIRDQTATHSDYPSTTPGTSEVLYERPYNDRLPTYHQLDVSVERPIELSSGLTMEAQVGAINVYDRNNIFYYDINTLERVDQAPILPYLSIRIEFD